MEKLAILISTFLRDSLLDECLKSILPHYQSNWTIIIGDQNDNKSIRSCTEIYKKYNDKMNIKYLELPFDMGLSATRNSMVAYADKLDIDYCLLIADSIHFIEPNKYDFYTLCNILTQKENLGIIGLKLKDRISWERNIKLIPEEHFYLSLPPKSEQIKISNICFQPCDIVKNCFLAKTKCLLSNLWDEELKLAEHESFFWELKQKNYFKVYYTEYLEFQHKAHYEGQYKKYRDRLLNLYQPLLLKKYNIKRPYFYEQGNIKFDEVRK